MTKALVIVNAASGRKDLPAKVAELRAAFDAAGAAPEFALASSADGIRALARRASGEGAAWVAAAGGDGTVSAVASELLHSSTALGVLPLGTLNHFAADLGVPNDLAGAAAALVAGAPRRVDAAEVNGHVFLNNSSIGMYPKMVLAREELRAEGAHKWIAMARAALAFRHREPLFTASLQVDGEMLTAQTPFVFVSNNEYAMRATSWTRRDALDRSMLGVWVVRGSGHRLLVRLGLRTLFGRLRNDRDMLVYQTATARVETEAKFLHVALDGEVAVMQPQLEYRILPQALTVMAPPREHL